MALLRPQSGYHADIIEAAAALRESLAMQHGFIDGNQRGAFASTILFLQINGATPTGEEQDWIDIIHAHLKAGTFREEVLESWLNAHTVPFNPNG